MLACPMVEAKELASLSNSESVCIVAVSSSQSSAVPLEAISFHVVEEKSFVPKGGPLFFPVVMAGKSGEGPPKLDERGNVPKRLDYHAHGSGPGEIILRREVRDVPIPNVIGLEKFQASETPHSPGPLSRSDNKSLESR